MKKVFLLVACMAVATGLQARLGETQSECETRYGKPFSSFEGGHVYEAKHFHLICVFKDGKAVAVVYEKREGSIFAEDKTAILQANADGKTWNKIDMPIEFAERFAGKTLWMRTDDAVAVYDSAKNQLSFYLAAYSAHLWGPEDTTADL